MVLNKEKEIISIKTVMSIKENGNKDKKKAKELFIMKKEENFRACLNKIKNKDWECMYLPKTLF